MAFAEKLRDILNSGDLEIREPNILFPPCMEAAKQVALDKIYLFQSDGKAKYYM